MDTPTPMNAWFGSRTISLSATAFQNTLSDLIAPVLAAGELISGRPVPAFANVARARLHGLTGTASLGTRSGQRLSITGQHVIGTDRVDGTPLALVPPAEATLTGHLERGWMGRRRWVESTWRVVAGQTRIVPSAGEMATPGFGTLNVRGGLTIAGTRGILGVENVFNRAFREHVDPGVILRPGRHVFLRVVRAF